MRRREAAMEGDEKSVEKITEEGEVVTETEKEKMENGEEHEESDVEESRALNTVDAVEGRGYHGVMEGPRPAKIIVTANRRRGHPADDTQGLDRNLPPPRLMEAPNHPPHTDYLVNYPGARLRVAAPNPSHHTPYGREVAVNRREEPHSIQFGSSSLSTSTYHHHHNHHHQREDGYLVGDGHVVPREPISYYHVSREPPTPATPPQPTLRPHTHPREKPRPPGSSRDTIPLPPPNMQPPPPAPEQSYPSQQQYQIPRVPDSPPFRPSKLLLPTHRPTTTPTPTTTSVATAPSPHTHPSELREMTHSNRPQVIPRRPYSARLPSTQSRSPPRQPSPSPPPLPVRRGQVVNAPRPAFTVLVEADDATASLTPLATISKSGVRAEIGHRAGSASRDRNPPTRPLRRPAGRVTRPTGTKYTFMSGEVYTPPSLQPHPSHPHPQKPFFRITTRRPLGQELAVIPYKESYSTFEPKYVKDTIAEMEFEPKMLPAPPPPAMPPAVHWFLMPVQGWFVLSIILAALVVVLGVGCTILYTSLRKQKRKMKQLTGGTTVMLPACCDPVKHEACGCRALAPLVRSHTLLSRASIMTSRASQRSLRSLSLPRHPVRSPSPPQGRSGRALKSLPTPSQHEKERDTTFDSITTTNTQLEVEDTPPPLAPKKSSLIGFQDAKGGGRESRLGLEGRGGGRDSRVAAYDGRHGSSVLHADSYGRGSCLQRHSLPSDVQLTTIYPPPRRFEL